MEYKAFLTDNITLIKKSQKLRYDVYCLENKYFDPNNYQDQLETDEYDKFATVFVAIDENENCIATARIINNNELGLQTENYIKNIDKNIDKNKIAELSRLILTEKLRGKLIGKKIVLDVCREMYQYSLKNNIEYWYNTMFFTTWKFFYHLGVYFEIIGDPNVWPEGSEHKVVPTLMNLKKTMLFLSITNNKIYQYFNPNGQKIDKEKEIKVIKEMFENIKKDLEIIKINS